MAFDVAGARAAGYSDEEIASFLGEQNRFDAGAALKAGYSPSEIIDHLSVTKPAGGGRGFVNPPAASDTQGNLMREMQNAELSDVQKQNIAGRWTSNEIDRLRKINPGASLEDLVALANQGYQAAKDAAPAPVVDRVKQYQDKGLSIQEARANAQFDEGVQRKLNRSSMERPADENGDRVSVGYNPISDAERNKSFLQQQADAAEFARIKANAEEAGPVWAGLAKGFGQAKGFSEAVIGFTGDAIGNDDIKKWGIDAYRSTMKATGAMSVAKDFTDISNASDAATYLAETLSYGAFQAAQALATGGVGSLAGKVIGREVLGQVVALAAGNVAQELGSIYGDAVDEAQRTGKQPPPLWWVAANAVAAAAVDTAADKFGIDALLKPGAKATVLARIGRAIEQPVVQGATEMAQKVFEEQGAGKDPFREGILNDYINEGAAGAVMGAPAGAISALKSYQEPVNTGPTAEDVMRSKGFMLDPAEMSAPVAPRVQDQPTVPTVPNVTATPATPVAQPVAAPTTDPSTGIGSILQREGLIGEQTPAADQGTAVTPEVPQVQPAAAGVAADAAASNAQVDAPVAEGAPAAKTAVAQDGKVIPTPVADPVAKLQQELADLKARTERAIAEKQAAEQKAAIEAETQRKNTGASYQQTTATPTPTVSPKLLGVMVDRAKNAYAQSVAAGKFPDLGNTNIYSEPVLYGIINAPDVGPELLTAARTELERRRAKPAEPQQPTGLQRTVPSDPAYAGQQPVLTTTGSAVGTVGEQRTVTPGGVKYYAGAASQGVDSQPQRAVRGTQPVDQGGRAPAFAQTSSNQPGLFAGAVTVGSDSPAQSHGGLVLAATAPQGQLLANQLAVKRAKGIVVQPVQEGTQLSEEQALASAMAHKMGKTVTWVEQSSGAKDDMPDGWVNRMAGDHIFMDINSSKPLLEIVMHEGTHALPTHIRTKLRDFVNSKVSQQGRDAFLAKYKYTGENKLTQDEEVLAYVSQLVTRRPEFIADLKNALGNKDFAEFARILLSKMQQWLGKGDSAFDSTFLQNHVADLQQVHDNLVQAYTQAMREQGMQPDAGLTAPVFAQKEDGKGRVGKVSTHVLAAQRGERVKSDKTRVGADEKAIIREAAKKMGVTIAEVEEMVRDNKAAHPASDGWAPLTLTGVKVDDDGKAELQYQTVPYSFNNDSSGTALSDGSPEYVAKVRNMAAGMLREVRGIYDRAQAGDGAAQKIIAQSGWYKEMRSRLRQEFGGMGDLFADLLGATSPNTPVRTNWDNSIEALRLATQGKFDALLPKWLTWARRVDDINTRFRARYNDMLESGMSKAAIKNDAEFKWLAEQASQIREFPDELLPLKSNGKKFGFNGKNVVRAIIDLWRVVKNADPDIRLGGTAPKAINFSGNLIGFRSRATIDVWAARMLQRLSGGLRIPSMAEGGVTGEALESGRNTLQFGFGQDVFSEAVKLIRNDPELSQDSTLRSINDDDLQALVWFIEKEVWTKGNWTSAAGEGGSFEFESDLAGVTDRDAVNQQRKIADSSVARSEEQTAAAQAEIERLTREMENFGGIPAANATLQANAEAVANKTAKPADVRASNAAAREALKKAKATPQYKALVAERNRQKNILKKPTTEQRAQMRADAVQKLEGMSRTVDRYTAGLSIQKGAEQGMEPTPPTDAEMAGLIEKVTDAVAQGDPGATVVGLKAIATEGRYGAPERALDLEVITTDEFNPAPMAAGVFSAAQEADQDAAFVARVLRPDEEFDPLLHRPGIELYFRDMNQAAEAARMMAQIPSIRLSKPSEFGPNYFAIGGYTVVVDGRPSEQARAGQMGKPVGMRVMYLPEFEARYGIDPRLENATDEELAGIVKERARDLSAFAEEVLQKFEGVSFAGRFDYEVDTRFAGEYQGAIDAYTNGKSAGGNSRPEGSPWTGRSNRESIAAATGRLQVNGSEPGAELPGGLDTQVPFSNKAGSGRAVEPDVQDGPGARPHAVRVRATHFSQQARTSLDGRYNGTGLKGAERTRLSLATDPRIKERVYFYVDEGNGIRPESGVGGVAHSADLRNIYDVTGDPEKLFRSGNDNTNESALLDAGYDGYYVPKVFNNQGVVVVLGNASRGIKVEPTEYAKGQRQAEPEPPYKRGLMSRELNKLDMPALQAVAPSAKLSMGTLQIDRAELDDARAELAKQGIDLPAAEPEVRFSNKATGERQIGINVRSDTKAGLSYADLLVDGRKAYETRDTDSLRPYVGRTVGIVRTGEGKAKAIGSVKLGEPITVGPTQFRLMQDQHLVPAGSDFDIKPGGEKFLYPITEAKRFDEEYDVEPGIVGRQIKGAPVFANKAQDLDQDITLEIPVEGGKTAKLTINAQSYLKQLDAREEALRMVKECMV